MISLTKVSGEIIEVNPSMIGLIERASEHTILTLTFGVYINVVETPAQIKDIIHRFWRGVKNRDRGDWE